MIDMMREKGVIRLTWEGVEILMGPPAEVVDSKKKDEADPRAAKRAHYANLLGTPPSDPQLDLLP